MMANKKRLIDEDSFENAVSAHRSAYLHKEDVIAAIANQKTVNAVEVVRCKDCKHKGWIQEPCHGKSVDFCHVWDSCVNNPDKCFCSYGERRADG